MADPGSSEGGERPVSPAPEQPEVTRKLIDKTEALLAQQAAMMNMMMQQMRGLNTGGTMDWLMDEKERPTFEEVGERVYTAHITFKGVFALLSDWYTMIQLKASMESDVSVHGGADALRAKLASIEEKVYSGTDGCVGGCGHEEHQQGARVLPYMDEFLVLLGSRIEVLRVRELASGVLGAALRDLHQAGMGCEGKAHTGGAKQHLEVAKAAVSKPVERRRKIWWSPTRAKVHTDSSLFAWGGLLNVKACGEEILAGRAPQGATLDSKTVGNYRPKVQAFMKFCMAEGRQWLPALEATVQAVDDAGEEQTVRTWLPARPDTGVSMLRTHISITGDTVSAVLHKEKGGRRVHLKQRLTIPAAGVQGLVRLLLHWEQVRDASWVQRPAAGSKEQGSY
eukprot:gene14170-biopygen14608